MKNALEILEIRNAVAAACNNAKSDIAQDLVFEVALVFEPEFLAIGDWEVLEGVQSFTGTCIQDRTMKNLEEKLISLGVKTYSACTHIFDEGRVVPIISLPIESPYLGVD